MATLGRIALRNFAMTRQAYIWQDVEGNPHNTADGFVGSGVTVFPSALEILEAIHTLPPTAGSIYLPTGMLVPFTPEIATFEPGDEDVGSYANAFDQTILSRLAGMRFSSDGMSYEDMLEVCRCFGRAHGVDGQVPGGGGLFYTGGAAKLIPDFTPDAGTRTSIRQRLGITDGFQSWSFMWQDGMEQAGSNRTSYLRYALFFCD